jgi:hypothetical protein
MYQPKFELAGFATLSVQRKQTVLRGLLEALISADWNYILENPDTPPLYDYAPQYILKVRPAGLDSWQDIPQTLALGSGDCVAAGTAIKTETGDRPIEEISAGDRLWTRGGLQRVAKAGLVRYGAPTVALITESSRVVMATPEHRIWTANRDWTPIGELNAKDSVLEHADDGKHVITKVRNVISHLPTAVYDLTVENWPEFFAGGVLVHNCKDFACWRVAELRNAGYDDVFPHIKVSYHEDPSGREPMMTVYHIQVRVHDIIEDPSALLGMPKAVSYDQLRGDPTVGNRAMAAGAFTTHHIGQPPFYTAPFNPTDYGGMPLGIVDAYGNPYHGQQAHYG